MASKKQINEQTDNKKKTTPKKVDTKTTTKPAKKIDTERNDQRQAKKSNKTGKIEVQKKDKLSSKNKSKETVKVKSTVSKKETEQTEVKIEDKKVINNDNILGIFEKIVILIAVALVFSLLGYFIGSRHNDKIDYSTAVKDLNVFIEQYNKIVNEYYVEVDKGKLIKGAISGMLSTLDGYTQVIDDSSNNFNITLEGEYEGLGIEIINNNYGQIEIYNVYEDTPASRAKLKIGDIVTKINDTELKNVPTIDFVNMIGSNENVKLTILRDEKEIAIDIKKEKIVLKSVSYEMLDNKIGYIKVDIFANNTYGQFKEALESLEKQNIKGLIIDLRDNTGGHLSTVTKMVSLFLDSSHVIYQTESRTETLKFYSEGNKDKQYNIVILQNEVSASASEIMASALKEQLDAYIIGKRSYGKGTVQQLETVEDIGQYKFTSKKWLTSEGKWLEGSGLAPDLEVNLGEEYYKNPIRKNDLQLKKAIEHINKK